MNLNNALESSVALTVYDVVKKKGIPSINEVVVNLGGSVGYEFLGKKVNDMITTRILPNYKTEGAIAGRIIWTPVMMGLIEQFAMGKKPMWGQLFMKSLVSLGALSIWKNL